MNGLHGSGAAAASHYMAHESIQTSSISEHEGLEPDMDDTAHMNFVDGRCSCCPYGYHVDLDFLRYCDNLNSGAYLTNLKKIRRNKRMLRKSMEVMLHQQQLATEGDVSSAPPPDVVHSTENFMNFVDYEQNTTNKFLDEIDSSVNQTLSSIDILMASGKKRKYGVNVSDSEDTEDDLDGPSPRARLRNSKYRTEAELFLAGQQQQAGSTSSLSSHDTLSSEQYGSLSSTQSNQYAPRTFQLTSAQLAGTMASLLPHDGHHDTSGDSSQLASISPDQLQAIREQMAVSLQRMRELEEQCKTIPVMQVRLSVLKEEKRLLALQLKAKNNKLNMRTIGVGDCRVDDYHGYPPGYPSLDSLEGAQKLKEDHEYRTYMEVNLAKQLPPPRIRPPMRSIGTGDGNVELYGTLQTTSSSSSEGIVRERELHTEQSSHVVEKEKEIHALLIGNEGRTDSMLRKMDRPYRPPTRNIGVGDGNVFANSNNVHVHEKELRTVIIGGGESGKSTRNVGVLCKAAMRDVGVSYLSSDAPQNTRTVAVGVGEGIFGELTEPIHTSQHISYNTLQQMNMAAFHSRNIKINWAELLPLLDEKLKKTVRSVAVMCKVDQPPQRDVGVQSVISSQCSVGVGLDTVDVEVRPIKKTRSLATEARPNTTVKSLQTDKGYMKDVGVATMREQLSHKGVNTVGTTTFPAATNTEIIKHANSDTNTDIKIFQALDQIKNTGCNTTTVVQYSFGTNTDPVEEPKVVTHDRAVGTQNMSFTYNKAVNTDMPRLTHTGVGNRDVHMKPEPERKHLKHVCIGVRPSLADRGVGDGSISHSDVYGEPKKQEPEQVQQAESVMQSQKVITTRTTSSSRRYGGSHGGRYGYNENNNNMARFGIEPESERIQPTTDTYTTERTSGGGSGGGGSRYTVETTTTRSSGGSSSAAPIRTTEIQTSSSRRYGSGGSRLDDTDTSSASQRTSSSSRSTESYLTGSSTKPTSPGRDISYSSSVDSTRRMSPSRDTSYSSVDSTRRMSPSRDTSYSTSRDSTFTTSSTSGDTTYSVNRDKDTTYSISGGSGDRSVVSSSTTQSETDQTDAEGNRFEWHTDPSGKKQMRVIQSVETTYVGKKPVHQKSDVVIQGEDEGDGSGGAAVRRVLKSDHQKVAEEGQGYLERYSPAPSGSSTSGGFRRVTKTTTSSSRSGSGGEPVTKEYSSSSSTTPQRLQGRTVTITETRIERRADGRSDDGSESPTRDKSIRSILKEPGSMSPNLKKKEIKFAEGTVGGYISSSGESDSEPLSHSSQESLSYDEGSYDGRLGRITYSCQDDEAIEQGQPGAAMFDQNIRET